MNKKDFFQFGFIFLVMSLFLLFGFTLTIYFGNPLGLSYHPEFFQGVLFSIALFGCLYYGWLKK